MSKTSATCTPARRISLRRSRSRRHHRQGNQIRSVVKVTPAVIFTCRYQGSRGVSRLDNKGQTWSDFCPRECHSSRRAPRRRSSTFRFFPLLSVCSKDPTTYLGGSSSRVGMHRSFPLSFPWKVSNCLYLRCISFSRL